MELNLRRLLFLLCLEIYISGSVHADNRHYVNGEVCLASQFCEKQNAVKALQVEFGMTAENATDFIESRQIERSCSCLDSCVYVGLCCQDKAAEIPPHLQILSDRLKADRNSYVCEEQLGEDTVVINTCPLSAPVVMRQRCAEVAELELLFTSNTSKLTYKNIYCGLCNGENFDDLKGWAWNFDCIENIPSELPSSLSTVVPLVNLTNVGEDSLLSKALENSCSMNQTIPIIPPEGIEVHHEIGVYLDSMSLCANPPISICPADSTSETKCKTGPVSLITFEGKVYRNKHCFQCNEGLAQEDLAICDACEHENCTHPALNLHTRPLIGSFGILVQPYDDSQLVECKTTNQQDCGGILDDLVTCGHGEFLQYQTSTCETICPRSYVLQEGFCEFIGLDAVCTSYVEADVYSEVLFAENSTNQLHSKTFMALRDGPTVCYNCTNLVAITATTMDFEITGNDEIRYKSNLVSANLVYKVDSVNYFVCIDQVTETVTTEVVYPVEVFITNLFLSISIVSLLLYFVAYLMFDRLRNVPGKIVAGNMMSLFFAYLFFLLRHVPGLEETAGCIVIGILINYFFLASFVFNIIYACFIVHSLDFIDFESNVNKWTAVKMWAVGLLTPLVVIVPGVVMDNFVDVESNAALYQPNYGGKQCFIEGAYGRLLFFIVPIGVCLFLAVCLYLAIILKLIQVAKQTSQVRSNHSEKITIAIKLLIVLGFNWVFALVASIEQQRIATFIFIVTCTLQGFFGFVVFICNKATLNDIKRRYTKKGSLQFSCDSSARISTKETATAQLKNNTLSKMESSKALLKTGEEVSV